VQHSREKIDILVSESDMDQRICLEESIANAWTVYMVVSKSIIQNKIYNILIWGLRGI
jgi:hypothetical protein